MIDYVIWDVTGALEQHLGERTWFTPWARLGYSSLKDAVRALEQLYPRGGVMLEVVEILERKNRRDWVVLVPRERVARAATEIRCDGVASIFGEDDPADAELREHLSGDAVRLERYSAMDLAEKLDALNQDLQHGQRRKK